MKKTLFILCILLFNPIYSYCKDGTTKKGLPQLSLKCTKPEFLKANDKVALISPSYFSPMEEVQKTAQVLRDWGLEPVIGPNVGKRINKKYAGTVQERLSDIRWAMEDKSIKAVICNRGGYGSIHLIDSISLKALRSSPKWVVGFSDISTIHGLMTRSGVMSIHGTMSYFLQAGGTDGTSTLLRELLMGSVPEYHVPANPFNIHGSATGTLVGGNICTFAPNLGSQADATAGEDLILFIEEVGESMHNIDRQMHILKMNGVLDRCKGVILGDFAECGTEFTNDLGQTMTIEQMMHGILAPYNIPVVCAFPGGHGDVNLPLVMGAPVKIDVTYKEAVISFLIEGQMHKIRTSDLTTFKAWMDTNVKPADKKDIFEWISPNHGAIRP